jgi:hypothetical protein
VRRTAVVVFVGFAVVSAVRPVLLMTRRPAAGDVVYAAFAVVAVGLCVLAAVWWLRRRVAAALRLFEIALLAELFVVQFFRLLDQEFAGYLLVFVNLALLGVCRALAYEHAHPRRSEGDPAIPVGEHG